MSYREVGFDQFLRRSPFVENLITGEGRYVSQDRLYDSFLGAGGSMNPYDVTDKMKDGNYVGGTMSGTHLEGISMRVGLGNNAVRIDADGRLWSGAEKFEDATFRVYAGVLYISDEDGSITIDAENKTIIINDGTNDRVLLGYGLGLF